MLAMSEVKGLVVKITEVGAENMLKKKYLCLLMYVRKKRKKELMAKSVLLLDNFFFWADMLLTLLRSNFQYNESAD